MMFFSCSERSKPFLSDNVSGILPKARTGADENRHNRDGKTVIFRYDCFKDPDNAEDIADPDLFSPFPGV